jgi:hypothetical protein
MAFIGFRDKFITMSTTVWSTVEIDGTTLRVLGTYIPERPFTLLAYVPAAPRAIRVNGEPITEYTWGPHYKTLTFTAVSKFEDFVIEIA